MILMFDKTIKDKSILVGNTILFSKNKWVPFTEINESLAILNHKIFDQAFNKILKLHTPKYNVAFLSLCTSTRPYYLGRKWKHFKESFGGNSDLIVVSSGGIIPEKFWDSYPFLNYDGHTTPKGFEALYVKKMSNRLTRFFKKHSYDYVIANFRPNLRNAAIADTVLKQLVAKKVIKDYKIIPDEDLYNDVKKRGFPRGKVFPDLDDKVLETLTKEINNFTKKL